MATAFRFHQTPIDGAGGPLIGSVGFDSFEEGMNMIEFFEYLGLNVADRWSKANFDNRALPDIACEALTASRPADHVTYEDIARWLATTEALPEQPNIDSNFGQPPLTVFSHRRFYIEALHWTTSTTDIHQHGFSGAFCVLAGSSLESTYVFETRRRNNVHMLLGDLLLKDVSILTPGDVRPIRSGSSLIHSVFHLDFPSVTLVVRTPTDIESKPQYSYAPPHLALDPYFLDPLVKRRVQSLGFLRRIGSPSFDNNALEALRRSDFFATYQLLRGLADLCETPAMARFVDLSRTIHGSDVDLLWASIEEEQRQRLIMRSRECIRDADGRFLLALLLNVRSRDGILSAVGARVNADQKRTLLEWCFALPHVDLGVQFDDLNKSLFSHLVDGVAVDDVLRRLATEFLPADIEARRSDIIAQCHRLRQDSVFRYLLEESRQADTADRTEQLSCIGR